MKKKHLQKINELIRDMAGILKEESRRLYNSGAIDPANYDPDQYVLAKISLNAAMETKARAFYPAHNKEYQKEIKNLSHF